MPSVTVLTQAWAFGSSTSPSMMTINSYARIMRDEPPFGPGRIPYEGRCGHGAPRWGRVNVTGGVYRRRVVHGPEHDKGVSRRRSGGRSARRAEQLEQLAAARRCRWPRARRRAPRSPSCTARRRRSGRRPASGPSRHGTMSALETNDPSAAKKAMLSGVGVSRIQKLPCVGASHRNTMPSAPPRSVTPIRPRARSAGVSATHRHTSQTVPSAAVITPRRAAKPSGTTPGHGGGRSRHGRGAVVVVGRHGGRRRSSAVGRRRRRDRRRPSWSAAPSSSSPHAARRRSGPAAPRAPTATTSRHRRG